MTPEVIRRHYLEAMGITAWACRYQLPNARPTEACEWDDTPAASTPPRERLQALLDDAPAPRTPPTDVQPAKGDVPASPSAVRALLEEQRSTAPSQPAKPSPTPAAEPQPTRAQPLEFHLSCVCIGGRWLSLHAGKLSAAEQRLLANMLQAAGLSDGAMPDVTLFKWPPMAMTFAADDPLEEAREGVSAFVNGVASRQGWQLEELLWWGADTTGSDHEALSQVLDVHDDQSRSLALPVWQAPALSTLTHSISAKRALWPKLHALGQRWHTPLSGRADDR
ncbi:hypothetical protein [Vreelandella arcis]|uniref:Uncharacterized protein n=1 Tax=Vreelandella arcis TaxID=416873 RepID=A0A1H0BWF1_9GAMM|nr:hypothetical protein [Halomonas arcis]SDN49954.1 hypothetical protein SAMN04487951_105237 [Halomonas arcis]